MTTVIMTVEGALANLPPWAADDLLYRSAPSALGLTLYRLFIENKDRVFLMTRNSSEEHVRQWLTREGFTSPFHILKCKPPYESYEPWLALRFVESMAEGWRNPLFIDNDSRTVFLAHSKGLSVSLLAEADRVPMHTRSRPSWDDLVSSIEAAHYRRAEQEVRDGEA